METIFPDGRTLSQVKADGAIKFIRQYLHDLTEFYSGDEGRFQRMVGSGGKSFDNAHPGGWATAIGNLSQQAMPYHAAELERIAGILAGWGHKCQWTGQRIEAGAAPVAVMVVGAETEEQEEEG